MKKSLVLLSLVISISSCDYNKGVPVIVNKRQSFIPGKCLYTYEGFGREETFDDDCEKYQVGDTLRGE